MGLFNKAPLIVHRRQNMSCTLQGLLDAMDDKIKQAQKGLDDIQKMVDECQSDIDEIRNVLQKMKNM